MDHETHGVKATIIDLGLARMDTHDGRKNETYWTPFEEEIFEGEGKRDANCLSVKLTHTFVGDYQFDIYRMMKHYNKDTWDSFCPISNVMVSPSDNPIHGIILNIPLCPVAPLPC